MTNPDRTHTVELNRAPLSWALDQGKLTFFSLPAALFWLNPSLLQMLQPLVDEVGPQLFRLLVAQHSSMGTEVDYNAMVTTLGTTFEEGFLEWGHAVGAAGWGRFELPVFNRAAGRAVIVVHDPWEVQMQQGVAKPWGCPFLEGKLIGIFSRAFGTNCWADEISGSSRVEFHIYPSDKTISAELDRLRMEHHEGAKQRLEQKTQELLQSEERHRAILSSLSEVVFTLDREGHFTSYHVPRELSAVHPQPDKVLGRHVSEVMPQRVAHRITSEMTELFKDDTPRTLRYSRDQGGVTRFFVTTLSVLHDLGSNRGGVTAIERDMTERMRADQELADKIDLIEQQQQAIRAMSTPIIQVWDGVIALPIVGIVDSRRSASITESLLHTIMTTRAHYAILDLTGVDAVDTAVADHFIKIIRAVELLGAECLVCGIQPSVAQTMATLGIGTARARTFSTMQSALASLIRRTF